MGLDESRSGELVDRFRTSMRSAAASIALITTRDATGQRFGMAVTSWASVSMSPPSVLVTINRAASIHPVITASGKFCLNIMGEGHGALLQHFSRSDMREKRFASGDWAEGANGLPVLRDAISSQLCSVDAASDYGTHTIFVGRVDDVILLHPPSANAAPLIWMDGCQASLAERQNPQTST
jgi:flavin reductase (DIM6/NTAB) family NADH-FMN oxidoreductase RutF